MRQDIRIDYPETKPGRTDWNRRYGLNSIYAGKKSYERSRDSKFWHGLVYAEVRRQIRQPVIFDKPVRIRFLWNDNLDVDNHAYMGKMIVDALKKLLIADDDRRHLHEVSHGYHDKPYILVTVTDDRDGGM